MWRTVSEIDLRSCFRKALESNPYQRRSVTSLLFSMASVAQLSESESLKIQSEHGKLDAAGMVTILEVTNERGSIMLYEVDM